MTTKPLTHEKVDIDNLQPYEIINIMPEESETLGRHFFINRKQDRFTFSARYCQTGTTVSGKKWLRWKNLFSFSVTFRQPSNSKVNNLNIFSTGVLFRKKTGVVNLTRTPQLVISHFPESVRRFIVEETLDLLARQNQPSTFGDDYSVREVSKFFMLTAYPFMDKINIVNDNLEIPLFCTSMLRAPSFEYALEHLKVTKDSNLDKYLHEHSHELSINNLLILHAGIDVLEDEDKLDLIKNYHVHAKKNNDFQFTQRSLMEVEPRDLATLRDILRKLNVQSRKNVLSSLYTSSVAPHILIYMINTWRNFTKLTKFIKLSHLEFEDFNELKNEISKQGLYYEGLKETKSAVEEKTELADFFDDKYFKIKEYTHFMRKNVNKPSVETIRRDYILTLGKKYNVYFATSANEVFDITVDGYAPFNKKSLLWKALKANIVVKKAKLNEHKNQTHFGKEIGYKLTKTEFSNVLGALNTEAKQYLTKNGLNISQENINICLAWFALLAYRENFAKYNQIIPRKFFTLIKKGIEPELALLYLDKRVTVKSAVDMDGLPLEWIYKAIGEKAPAPTVDLF